MLDINPVPRSAQQQEEPTKPVINQPRQGGNVYNTQNSHVGPTKLPKNIFMESGEEISKLVGTFTLIVLILILVAAGGLYWFKTQKQAQLANKDKLVQELKAQLNTPELKAIDAQATRYSLGLKELATLMSGSTKYSEVFSRLDALTPNEIILNNFSINNKGVIQISGQTDIMDNVATYVKSLQNAPELSEVILSKNQLSSTTTDEPENYGFSITAKINNKQLTKDKNSTQAGESNATDQTS